MKINTHDASYIFIVQVTWLVKGWILHSCNLWTVTASRARLRCWHDSMPCPRGEREISDQVGSLSPPTDGRCSSQQAWPHGMSMYREWDRRARGRGRTLALAHLSAAGLHTTPPAQQQASKRLVSWACRCGRRGHVARARRTPLVIAAARSRWEGSRRRSNSTRQLPVSPACLALPSVCSQVTESQRPSGKKKFRENR